MCLCACVYCTFIGISKYQLILIHLNSPNRMERSIGTKKKKKESYKSDADGNPRSKGIGTLHGDFGYRLDLVLKEVRN